MNQQQRAQDVVAQMESNRRKRQRRTQLVNQTADRVSTNLTLQSNHFSNNNNNKRTKFSHHVNSNNSSTSTADNQTNDTTNTTNNTTLNNSKYVSEEQQKQFEEAMDDLLSMDDNLVDSIQFSTVNLALLKLKQLCHGRNTPVPIMLKHMLHAMLEPNMQTQIERELDELISERIIRQFHMHHLGSTVTAYCYTDDLIQHIRRSVDVILSAKIDEDGGAVEDDGGDYDNLSEYREKQKQLRVNMIKKDNERLRVLSERYIDDLIPEYSDTVISKDELKRIIECDQATDMSLLMKIGLFTIKDNQNYYFNAPGAGQFIVEVKGGREEIVSILKRKKYKEIMLHTLRERKLKKTNLGIDWHIRELLGIGVAQITQTSNGAMLQLKK